MCSNTWAFGDVSHLNHNANRAACQARWFQLVRLCPLFSIPLQYFVKMHICLFGYWHSLYSLNTCEEFEKVTGDTGHYLAFWCLHGVPWAQYECCNVHLKRGPERLFCKRSESKHWLSGCNYWVLPLCVVLLRVPIAAMKLHEQKASWGGNSSAYTSTLLLSNRNSIRAGTQRQELMQRL